MTTQLQLINISISKRDKASTTMEVKEQGYLHVFFRKLSSPLGNKDITAFLRKSDQCLFPSPQNAFCFSNLSRLVLKIFRVFEKHEQN